MNNLLNEEDDWIEGSYVPNFRSLLASIARPNESWLYHLVHLSDSNYHGKDYLLDQAFSIYICSLLEGEFAFREKGIYDKLRIQAIEENSSPLKLAVQLANVFFNSARGLVSQLDRADMESLWRFRTIICHSRTEGIDNGANGVLWVDNERVVRDNTKDRARRENYVLESSRRGNGVQSHIGRIREIVETMPTYFWMFSRYIYTSSFLNAVYEAVSAYEMTKPGVIGGYVGTHEQIRFVHFLAGSAPQPLSFKEFVTLRPDDPRQWW